MTYFSLFDKLKFFSFWSICSIYSTFLLCTYYVQRNYIVQGFSNPKLLIFVWLTKFEIFCCGLGEWFRSGWGLIQECLGSDSGVVRGVQLCWFVIIKTDISYQFIFCTTYSCKKERIDYYFYVVTWLDWKRNRGFWGSVKFLENTNLSAV